MLSARYPVPHKDPFGADSAPVQAAATRATKQELAGSYDDAFASYITAAQGYLFLLRHTADAGTRDRMRTLSNKLVERAERIKQAKKIDPQICATNALAIGAQEGSTRAARGRKALMSPKYRGTRRRTRRRVEDQRLAPGTLDVAARARLHDPVSAVRVRSGSPRALNSRLSPQTIASTARAFPSTARGRLFLGESLTCLAKRRHLRPVPVRTEGWTFHRPGQH